MRGVLELSRGDARERISRVGRDRHGTSRDGRVRGGCGNRSDGATVSILSVEVVFVVSVFPALSTDQ